MTQEETEPRRGDDLAGKVALVTGAGRNIGRAIARSLGAGGASVAVCARTSADEAGETARMIRDAGSEAEVFIADVGKPEDAERLVTEVVERFGRLDILVNNAATRRESALLDISFDEWREVLSTNLDSVFLTCRAALPHLLESGSGAIINLGGMTAHAVAGERAHVITSKAGVVAFTRALAIEFADQNVTANCVVPGMIDTVRGLPGAPPRPASRRVPPVGRMGNVWEVASMVRMLAGPDARYTTGQTIHLSGGSYMP